MKKNSLIISSIICFICSCFFVNPAYAYNDITYTKSSSFDDLVEEVSSQNNIFILDDKDNNVTDIFLKWYGENKPTHEVIDYLSKMNYSIMQINDIENHNSIDGLNRSPQAFETKSATRTFIDSFNAVLIDGQSQNVQFTTTISGTISYNANTYDVVDVYGESMNCVYTGNIPLLINFYASGYSTSTSISADKTYGNVTGSCSLYATLYPSNPPFSSTVYLKRITHTLSIRA